MIRPPSTTNHDGEISLGELDKAMTARREQMRERWRGRGGMARRTSSRRPRSE